MGSPRGPSLDDYQQAARLRGAMRAFSRQSERIARENGLTPRQYLLLLMIKGAADGTERSTVTELVGQLQLTQSTVTELVGRAETAGLLSRRQSSSDARVANLFLTPKGEQRLGDAFVKLGPERKRLLFLLSELTDQSQARASL